MSQETMVEVVELKIKVNLQDLAGECACVYVASAVNAFLKSLDR